MILIKNIEVFSPKSIAAKDVLITSGKITLIKDDISKFDKSIEVINGKGKNLFPAL